MRRSAEDYRHDAKENALFLRFRNPLPANLQIVFRQHFADALRRIAIREEKPDGFAATELETFVINLDLPRAGKMKPCDDALQIRTAVLDLKFQFAVMLLDSQIEQKRHQPVAVKCVIVLRQDFFHAGGVIVAGSKIGAEQQKIFRADQRRQLRQNLFRLEIRNHAEESDEA